MASGELPKRETRKRKREIFSILALTFLFIIIAWFEFRVFFTSKDLPFEYSIFFFGLVNFNLVLLLWLFFLIFRNLFKAFVEQKRGVGGSSLRSRLSISFFLFSSVPTILMFFVSVIYINTSFDKWFSEKMTDVMKGALEVTTHFYSQSKKQNFYAAHMIAQKVQYTGSTNDILFVLRQQQQIYNLDAVEYYDDLVDERLLIMSGDHAFPDVPRASIEFLEKGLKQKAEASTVHEYTRGNLIRAMVPVKGRTAVVVASSYVPLSLISNMNTIGSVYEDIKGTRSPIQNNLRSIYIIILILMTLVILFCSTWFGFYMAQHLSEALSVLGKATKRVAQGNYEPVAVSFGETEVIDLAKNFNAMVSQLDASQQEINQATNSLQQTLARLDERSRYIEVVLSNVSTAVISLDKNDNITTINERAARMFRIKTQDYLGRALNAVIGETYYRLYRQMFSSMSRYELRKLTRQMDFEINGPGFPALFTISILTDDKNEEVGKVISIDDLTDVLKSQKVEAWKEVARRIAHEIKNPLTPIKLSAQRLQKKFGQQINDEAFKACIDMIIQQTDEMKNLVNEFSDYARMPVLNKELNDLNQLIHQVTVFYKEAYKKINFELKLDVQLSPFFFDKDQINRVLINLIENATMAVADRETQSIIISTKADSTRQIVQLMVSDNGIGVPEANYAKLFDPYFSTKPTGSGLGLAIVSKVIEDHGGVARACPNEPNGLSIVIELPYKLTINDKDRHV